MKNFKPYEVTDVFTPTQPATASFVERDSLNASLLSALKTPGKQIVVYGHSGSGKTTLLEKKLNEYSKRRITSRCTAGLTFDQIILDAFDQLAPLYTSEQSAGSSSTIKPSISAEYEKIKLQLSGFEASSSSTSKEVRVVPPQLTVQSLARFMGESQACWILEDFHKVDHSERTKLAQSMKLFVDMAIGYPQLKIIAIGAVDTARQVVEYDPEMRNRVSELYVPLMTDDEIRGIISNGETLLNLSIPHPIQEEVVKYSGGLGSVCHQLCLYMCFHRNIERTAEIKVFFTNDLLRSAIKSYVDDASDTLKSAFEKALKRGRVRQYDNQRLILKALCEIEDGEATFAGILAQIKSKETSYPSSNLTHYLKKLTTADLGSVVLFNSNSGMYRYADPFHRAYASSLFYEHKKNTEEKNSSVSKLLEELLKNIDKSLITMKSDQSS